MNITNKDIEALKYKKIKILRKIKFNNNCNNFLSLSLSNKFKNRRMLNEKNLLRSKLKLSYNLTNIHDISNHSSKIDFASSEKIIQRAKEFHNSSFNTLFKEKDKNESTFLTENKSFNKPVILPVINFNQNLNLILKNISLYTYSNKSLSNLKLKNRIKWKFNYINNLCKNLINSHVKNDFLEKMEENAKKSELIYNKYKTDIKNYISFLNDEIIKEEEFIFVLKGKKRKLINNIKRLNENISKFKEIRNQCLDIKNFLLKVKGENKNKNLTLSPIKVIKNKFDIMRNNEIKKTPKNTQDKFILELNHIKNNFNNYTSKNLRALNQKIFSTPDEFMDMYEEKLFKIRNKIIYYNKIMDNIIILKKYKEKNMIDKPTPIDKIEFDNYYSIIDLLKSRNIELQNKLNEYNSIKKIKNKGFKILEIKIRSIILNINSFINLKEKCFSHFKSIYEVIDSFENGKNRNLHLLKILEKITDFVLEEDRKYREEPKLKYLYSKIKLANEQEKFRLNRKIQVYIINQKELEKNKKILEYHRKTRIIPFNKNGINLTYYHKTNYMSNSFKTRNVLINRESKKKREEFINLINYN